MLNNSRRFLRSGLHSSARRILALGSAVLLVVSLCSSLLQPGMSIAQAAPKQPRLPTNLTNRQAHPGSVLIAFRRPVQASGNHVAPDGSGRTAASSSELNTLNGILDSLRATELRHLFANIPAAALDAARAKAQAATGAYVTDLTQVYQVIFDPSINDGEAVNRLASSSLVSSAMPDWILRVPPHEQPSADARAAVQAVTAARAAGVGPSLLALPPNYAYISDGQSYQDASSNNITGAWAMLTNTFGKQPGEGEVITNISLGTIDKTSTVLENGQRYLEQRGFPKIPVWLSSLDCPPGKSGGDCTVILDPTATNTKDGQGDLTEVLLDFSVMAPPPRGDPRVPNPQVPGQIGEILGTAYGADFRLINPLVNTTPNFFAAFMGGAFLQNPPPTVMTASIGTGFAIPGFSDYFFEDDAIIHDIVSTIVNGQNIFVTISAGDGQTSTVAAMNPNGLTGPHEVTTDASKVVDINDPNVWGNPNYSYGLTFEPQFLIDSGANSAGGNALNDVFNNAPWNAGISQQLRHAQHTTETRWTGQQNFHSGNGSRTNVAAPADDVLMLAQVEDSSGIPIDPVSVFPRLIGGTSASAPEIAAAAAVVRQAAKLLGHPLTARATRNLLAATGRTNHVPIFDLDSNNVGKVLDLTRAVESLFASAGQGGSSALVRMTVADRKAVFWGAADKLRSSFWSDTPQDPTAHTATIDLSQGLISPSSRTNQTIGSTGDNVNAPITFAVDGAYLPLNATFAWTLSSGATTVAVPTTSYDASQPYLRLLPAEIFGLLGLPVTASTDRTVAVTASSNDQSITTNVAFKGQTDSTYTHAIPPSFNPLFRPGSANDRVTFTYDLRGLRDGSGGVVNGGVLIVSDIDRAVPQAFPDLHPDAHGIKKVLNGVTGSVTVSAAELPHGVGTYGVAVRGTKNGAEIAGSTSHWIPLRYGPANEVHPSTPKVLAEAGFGGSTPRFYDIADFEPGGSPRFAVSYDVTTVSGAKGALIELSAPATDFFKSLFIAPIPVPLVNNFTNPLGDRLDSGNNFGQPGSTFHTTVSGASGSVILNGQTIGLTIPAGACDSAFQVRVFATNAQGKIIGVASNPSVIDYADLSVKACNH